MPGLSRAIAALALVVCACLATEPGWCLTDREYQAFIAQSPEFKQADQALNEAYRRRLASLDEAGKAQLKDSQRAWIKRRDSLAQRLEVEQGLTPATAQAQVARQRAAQVQAFVPAPPALAVWAGQWERLGEDSFLGATLTISQVTPQGFDFELLANNGGNSGEVSGQARLHGGDKAAFAGEENCRLEFALKQGRLSVEASEGCLALAGMGVFFSGDYARAGSQPAKSRAPVTPEEKALAQLVGKYYQLFLDTMQMASDDEDLDGLGAKVRSHGVRGLFTAQESIVMRAAGGGMWAAVIDGDQVRYFSNDPAWQRRLPKTIEDWRSRFADKAVRYMSAPQPK